MDPQLIASHWNPIQAFLYLCSGSEKGAQVAANPHLNSDQIDDLFLKEFEASDERCIDFEGAEARLLQSLSKGVITATGFENGRGERRSIPADHWCDLRFLISDPQLGTCAAPRPSARRPGATHWTHVLFQRADILRLREPQADTESAPTQQPKRRPGRKPGQGSLAEDDARLVQKMLPLVQNGEAPWKVAWQFVHDAAGHGTQESKAKRLCKRLSKFRANK